MAAEKLPSQATGANIRSAINTHADEIDSLASGKVDKATGMSLISDADKQKIDSLPASFLTLGNTSQTAYRGDRGTTAYEHSQSKGNPHETTKSDVGLGNADNTSDANKPISSAVSLALSNKADKSTTINNKPLSENVVLSKSDIGLPDVDNTSDANKPISNATATALNSKVDKTTTINNKPLSENIVISKSDVSLGDVDNTSDNSKPVSVAQQDALNLKSDIQASQQTTTQLVFTSDAVSGSVTAPLTGNITGNVTGAKIGVTVLVIHNNSTEPTFDSKFKKLSGSGSYATGSLNFIYCQFIDATNILYSINQITA